MLRRYLAFAFYCFAARALDGMKNRFFLTLILLITLAASASRLPQLSHRPMHCDEAVHALKCNDLWQTGEYKYDLHEYHGPTLYYCTLPIIWLSGAKDFGETAEWMYRLVPVLFGIGLILLLPLIRDGLGRWAIVWAAMLTAISPAMSFYGRYYIQETLLVFFTFAAIGCGWRYVRSRRTVWAILAGGAIGLMHATKETCIIALSCLLAALIINTLWHWRPSGIRVAIRGYVRGKTLIPALLVGLVISITLYSGVFTNASGPLDSIKTFTTYFDRAGGHGLHDHAWDYYLRMLIYTHYAPGPWWSEAFIVVLALVGMIAALSGRGPSDAYIPFLRLLTIYTLLMVVVYSAIPYKTPWCLLGFLHGIILLAGVGAVVLVQWVRLLPLRAIAVALLLAGASQLGWQAYRANTKFCADYRNPYVYSHPRFQIVELARRVEDIASVHPNGKAMMVKIMAPDYWPLPWYLRRLTRVGYWENVPDDPEAPVIICDSSLQEILASKLVKDYQMNSYGLRSPHVVLWLYVDRELWNKYVDERLR